jgi:transmembrane sensor
METGPANEREIARAAADWWTRLREPAPSAETLAGWQAWMAADERHARAFDQLNALGEWLRVAPAPRQRELLDEFAPRGAWVRRRAYAMAMAATLVLALLGWWGHRFVAGHGPVRHYASAVGEDRDIRLPDGTDVALGAASSLTARYGDARRDIELDAGEAYFKVTHDRRRPFVVDAGSLRIEDLGTAFNVRRTGERVSVAVTEGRVRVSSATAGAAGPQELVAGQRAEYDPRGGRLRVTQVAAEQAAAWRHHQLEFVNEPLSMVIANVNRYSRRPLQLADPQLGRLMFTGTVNTTNIDGWIGALPHVFPLQVSRFADHVVLSSARH